VVFIGNDSETPLPTELLTDLAQAERPVLWMGYNLEHLPFDLEGQAGFAPTDLDEQDQPTSVEYKGERYPAEADDVGQVDVFGQKAHVLATYSGGQQPVPYLVQGGNYWYVNGLPNLDSDHPDTATDAPTLIFADVLHDFFGSGVRAQHQAVIRLEDVSVHVDPDRLIETVDFLAGQRVPFALGLIPAQRLEDGRVISLQERPEFVKALRYAQEHGATIVLHGYHHTFGSGEDFEFWDDDNDAPLPGENWGMYAFKVEDGIRILRDLGLEPRLWETPHYAASPLAYQVFSHYFSHAFENREPMSWLPYPAGPDAYGQTLIPETLGYINPARVQTVQAQLERACLLKIVRDGWAAGFYHPASVPLAELKSLVSGLRRQGYQFVDLRALPMEVRFNYQPSPRVRLANWLTIDMGLNQAQLERRFDWWPTVRQIPWPLVLVVAMGAIFLARLREQWRPAPEGVRSLVEAIPVVRPGRRLRPAHVLVVGLAAALVLLTGAWAFGHSKQAINASGRLTGWSSLAWTIEYDGYGKAGIESGALGLEPLPSLKPSETRAALAVAGDPNWRDYSFTVRMNTQQQLRQNSPPNAWETGWLFFRYQGEDRSYYVAHKTNGLELGKLVPPAGTGQIFLVTSPDPPAQLGRWYDYRIDVQGPTIQVYVDGQLYLTYTDPDPTLSGRVGLYTEDAHVYFQDPVVTPAAVR